MLTRRTAIRIFSHAAATLAIGATIPLTAAEEPFKPVPILLRETWSDGHVSVGWTWLLAPTPRPYHHECVCGDMWIVTDEVV